MNKVLVSRGVLMDLLTANEPHYKAIATILSRPKKLKVRILFTSSTLDSIHYSLTNHKTANECREILRQLMNLGKVIGPDEKTYREAISLPLDDHGLAMDLSIAENHHVDYMVVKNVPRKKIKRIQLITGEQLLNALSG
jgi:hypothetical protein